MMIQDEVKLLRDLPLFSGVDPARLKLLCFASMRESFEPGDALFHEGDSSHGAYVILSGTVEVRKSRAGVSYQKSGGDRKISIVGQSSMLSQGLRSATVVAVTTVETLHISSECFLKVMATCSKSSEKIMRSLGAQMREDEVHGVLRAQ